MVRIIFIWRIASDYPSCLIAVCKAGASDVSACKRAEMMREEPVFQFSFAGSDSQLTALEYLPNSALLPVVCSKVAKRISRICGETVQMFPVKVVCEDSVQDWVLVNPVNSVVGVDWHASDALLIPGTEQVMKFRTFKPLPGVLDGFDVARLREFLPFILVSERFRAAFVSETGCEFIDPASAFPRPEARLN